MRAFRIRPGSGGQTVPRRRKDRRSARPLRAQGSPRLVARRCFAARRAAALDRGSGRRPVAEKHRWTDGPRTLATLWRWRRWRRWPPIRTGYPPCRRRSLPPAGRSRRPTRRPLPRWRTSTIGSRKMQADRASTRQDLERRTRRPSAETAAGSTEGPSAAPREPQPAAFQPAAVSAAARAASFQPALFGSGSPQAGARRLPCVRRNGRVPGLEGVDLVNASCCWRPEFGARPSRDDGLGFSSWHGLQLVVLASLSWQCARPHRPIPVRQCRSGVRHSGGTAGLSVASQLMGVGGSRPAVSRRWPCSWACPARSKGVSQPDRSLLDAFGVLALLLRAARLHRPMGGWPNCSFSWQARDLVPGGPSANEEKTPVRRGPLGLGDNRHFPGRGLFWRLFPTDLLRLSWREPWLQFRYVVLPHWSDFWWFRWGVVAVIAAMVAGLLCSQARRTAASS